MKSEISQKCRGGQWCLSLKWGALGETRGDGELSVLSGGL